MYKANFLFLLFLVLLFQVYIKLFTIIFCYGVMLFLMVFFNWCLFLSTFVSGGSSKSVRILEFYFVLLFIRSLPRNTVMIINIMSFVHDLFTIIST